VGQDEADLHGAPGLAPAGLVAHGVEPASCAGRTSNAIFARSWTAAVRAWRVGQESLKIVTKILAAWHAFSQVNWGSPLVGYRVFSAQER